MDDWIQEAGGSEFIHDPRQPAQEFETQAKPETSSQQRLFKLSAPAPRSTHSTGYSSFLGHRFARILLGS